MLNKASKTPVIPVDILARDIACRLDMPIVLIGLMGAGKSRLGRILAKELSLPFYDSDTEIEQSAGRDTLDIIDQIGEMAFRQAEGRVIARLLTQGRSVIAVGSGAMVTPHVAEMIYADAVTIWVRADMNTMISRLSRETVRPHLAGRDVAAMVKDMVAVHYPLFEQANVTVESHGGPVGDTVHQALFALRTHLDAVIAGA